MTEKYTPKPEDYIRVQGNKQYLPVPNRVQWFRGDHPDWGLNTTIVTLDWTEGFVIMRAEVLDPAGYLIASGTKTETRKGFADFVEKAETGAVGRALARAGYGTEDALDLEGDRLADAPIAQPEQGERDRTSRQRRPPATTPAPARTPEENAVLDEILALPGMTHERMRVWADRVGVEKGQRATLPQLLAILTLATDDNAAPKVVHASGAATVQSPASPEGAAPAPTLDDHPTLEDVLAVTGGEEVNLE